MTLEHKITQHSLVDACKSIILNKLKLSWIFTSVDRAVKARYKNWSDEIWWRLVLVDSGAVHIYKVKLKRLEDGQKNKENQYLWWLAHLLNNLDQEIWWGWTMYYHWRFDPDKALLIRQAGLLQDKKEGWQPSMGVGSLGRPSQSKGCQWICKCQGSSSWSIYFVGRGPVTYIAEISSPKAKNQPIGGGRKKYLKVGQSRSCFHLHAS